MNQIKSFVDRHIGIGADDQKDMLDFLGYIDMHTFIAVSYTHLTLPTTILV